MDAETHIGLGTLDHKRIVGATNPSATTRRGNEEHCAV